MGDGSPFSRMALETTNTNTSPSSQSVGTRYLPLGGLSAVDAGTGRAQRTALGEALTQFDPANY